VPREAAEGGLAEALTEVPEAEALDRVAQRYWRTRVSNEPRDRLRKLWAYLVRRGFPSDLVRARLAELWPRWRDALDGLEAAEGGS
jgi:SOS response regulatory protein OraA/RecX